MTAFGQESSKHIDRHNDQIAERMYCLKERGEKKDRRKKHVNITKSAFILIDYHPILTFAIDNSKIYNRILGSHQIFSKPISTNLCLLSYVLRIDEISIGQFHWQ